MFVRIALFVMLAMLRPAWAESVTIYTEHFPPYQFIQEGKVVGINAELTLLVCERAEVDCELELLPWSRSFQLTRQHKFSGLISTARYKEREQQFKWVGPLVKSTSYLYRLKHRDDISPTSLNDATRYTIGIQPNDIYEAVLLKHGFEKGNNLLNVSYKNADMQLFIKGKLDLIIGSPLTLNYQIHPLGFTFDDLVPVLEFPLDVEGNYLALNAAFPESLRERLQWALDSLRVAGDVDSLIQKYQVAQTATN